MLGARVAIVRAIGPTLWRRARADGSYASANDPRVLVGLGDTPSISRVRVQWPGGERRGMDGRSRRSIHDAHARRGPMRAAILISIALLSAGGCATGDERHDRQLLPVTLPDLSRLEESVQAQLRERYAALTAKRGDPRTAASDLATEYGEMGKLLLAAELLDPAEAALLNAQTLAAGAITWPYYLGHLYRKKGDIPTATVAFERALRLSPSDVPTMTWLGEAALDQGRPDAAQPLFAKAVSLEPGSAAAHYGLGRAALGKKDYAGAARHLRAGTGARRQRVSDPLLAGDGVPRSWATNNGRSRICSNAARCRRNRTR